MKLASSMQENGPTKVKLVDSTPMGPVVPSTDSIVRPDKAYYQLFDWGKKKKRAQYEKRINDNFGLV